MNLFLVFIRLWKHLCIFT